MSPLRTSWAGIAILVCALAIGVGGAAQEKGFPSKGVAQTWSLSGAWTGVASNSGTIYASSMSRKVTEFDVAGKPKRTFTLPEGPPAEPPVSALRLAHFTNGFALVVFKRWGSDVRAFDLNGELLWSYPGGQGVDDVWPADLDADGKDEVIVGYNGDTGLHVVDAKGQLRWKTTNIGNVWHVCAGDILGNGTIQVVTTSARGEVHLFDKGGNSIKDLGAGCYASMVRVANPPDGEKGATILVCGSTLTEKVEQSKEVLVALSGDGTRRWTLKLPMGKVAFVDSASVAPGRPWIAVGMRGGIVNVVDVNKGAIIASMSGQGEAPEVGWVTQKATSAPLLLVATRSALNAFRIIEKPNAHVATAKRPRG